MRGVRAVTLCLLAVLVLSGCMRTSTPVAGLQPQGDLDSLAYGPPTSPALEPASRSDLADSGGAIAALALSGCLRAPGPVATAQPRGDLDSYAYGGSYAMVPTPVSNAAAPASARAPAPRRSAAW